MNRYYTLEESEQFTFYRVPKTLILSVRYKNVSAAAKLLYGLMLDRMGLSQKNGWADDNGRTYIYFTVEDACESLGCGKDKILRLFNRIRNLRVGLSILSKRLGDLRRRFQRLALQYAVPGGSGDSEFSVRHFLVSLS